MAIPLLYGLYKLTNRNDETITAKPKIAEAFMSAYQRSRHHENKSIISEGQADINTGSRDVYIASRVLMGGRFGGAVGRVDKEYVDQVKDLMTAGLYRALDDAPDPSHHWCVV